MTWRSSFPFYALPAHLGLNLLWLALYLRDGRAVWWVPWVGVAAMGVSLYMLLSGNPSIEPVVAASSLITFAGVLLFALIIFMPAKN